MQYLNCKILHGGTLLKPWPSFSGDYVIPSPQLNENQKKGLRRKLKCFFLEIKWRPQKQVFASVWDYIRPEFLEFIRVGWPFFVWLSSVQISLGGRLNLNRGTPNLDGGTLTLDEGTRPPYNLSTAYMEINCSH